MYISGKGSGSIVRAAVDTSQVAVQDRAVLLGDMQESVGDICHLPLDVRRRVLKSVVRLVEDRLVVVQCLSVTSLDTAVRKTQLETFFNTVTLAGEEGLVVKDLTSPYLIGEKSRKSAKWVKMKPEYGDQTTDLDLIVLGAGSRMPIPLTSHIPFFVIFHQHLANVTAIGLLSTCLDLIYSVVLCHAKFLTLLIYYAATAQVLTMARVKAFGARACLPSHAG